MVKATERQLSSLHGKVAQTLSNTLEQADTASLLLDVYKDELPDDVKEFLEKVTVVHPSVLTVATKFLKDNEITVDAEQSGDLADLRSKLQAKNKVLDIPLNA